MKKFSRYDYITQRLLVLFPALFLFFFCIFRSLKISKLNTYYYLIVLLLFSTQIITHTYLLFQNRTCMRDTNKICNNGALVIGLIYFLVLIKCFYKKYNFYTFIALIIASYMILSHIVTIFPLKGLFRYNNILLSIFDLNSYILVMSNKFHERKLLNELDILKKNINNKSVIDCGSYIGYFSIFFANNNNNITVYSIEPSKKNYNYINSIKINNNINNLIPLNILLDKETNKNFINYNKDMANSFYEENKSKSKSKNKNSIRSNTLDNLVNNGIIKRPIGLLHYDVEGVEFEVLLGSFQTIIEDKPYIIVKMLEKSKIKNDKIFRLLNKLNYKARKVNESCSFFDIYDKIKCRNYIFEYHKN